MNITRKLGVKAPRISGLQILDRDLSRFTSRVADVMVRKSISLDGFLQTLIRRPGLNTGSFFLRAGSHVPGRTCRVARAGSQVTVQVASAEGSPLVQNLMIYINIKCCFVCKSCYNV